MGKNFKKILCVILSLVLILGSLPLSSLAADSKDGASKLIAADDVVIKASTDKSKYQTDEEITIKLTVTNKSSKKYDNIGINMAFNGFKFDSEKGSDIIIGELNPGETKTAEFNVNYVKLSLTQRFIFRIVMGLTWMLRNIWGFNSETVRKYVKVGEVKYLFVFCAYEAEGEEEPKPEAKEYTVSFDLNYDGAEDITDQTVVEGECAQEPAEPTRDGYKFIGWYAENSDEKYDFTAAVTSDITLYAKWIEESGEEYTVSFESNGGSSVESQVVAEGECAQEPAEPTRDGYKFIGWFAENSDEKYDFTSAVSSDITLYAKWEESDIDDGNDKEDTEITENDKYILSANKYEVVAESNTNVAFHVDSTLTIPYFELYIDGENTGVKLYDDGDDDNHYDDIPNDGCYSGIYSIDISDERDVKFTAKGMVGNNEIITNEIGIYVYYELTDEEIAEMKEVESKIAELMESAVRPEHVTAQQRTEACYDAVMEYLETLEKNGIIKDLDGERSSGIISFVYAKTQVEGGVLCSELSSGNASIDSEGRDPYVDGEYEQVSATNLNNPDLEYITYKERAVILNYCAQNDASQTDRVAAYTNVANILENAGFEVDNEFSITVDDFKSLQGYQFIATDCHGSFYKGTPVICTDQVVTDENRKTYSADLKDHKKTGSRISAVTIKEGGTYYWIRPEFFNHYYKDDPLDCSIFYLNVCKGAFSNTTLVDAIREAGANAVVAYSETVYTFYGTAMLEDIVNSLLEGKTIDQAVSYAKEENGANDLVWGNSKYETLKEESAECRVYGTKTATIHNSLRNGNFDIKGMYFSNFPALWKTYGDARAIFKLSGLTTQSAPKMAIISSGFGSMNDETTSCIYQTILVPNSANTIEFSYDVVSEEPMEYVGTQYNDIFQADILNTNGDILDTLAFESVNSSEWFAIEGIDFPGGDDTTYHTRWKTVNSDAISKYCGQLVVIRFTVQDAGDAIYDTATLIDSVTIK